MCRVAVEWRSASKENFALFKKKHPSIKLTYAQWAQIIYGYNESFREYILETGSKERIIPVFGDITILKKRRKKVVTIKGKEHINLPVDWKKTKEKGKKIYLFNYHTEGFSYRWYWYKRPAKFRACELWYFKPLRVTSRLLNHYLKINSDYQHIYNEWNFRS